MLVREQKLLLLQFCLFVKLQLQVQDQGQVATLPHWSVGWTEKFFSYLKRDLVSLSSSVYPCHCKQS